MANCSFISATEARNLARNNTLLWTEICEVQTQILAAIDGNLYSVLINDGTPMTATQAITSVEVTGGGSGYTLTSATAVINENGTGGTLATVVPVVTGTTITSFNITNGGSGYTPVDVTATVGAPSELVDSQDETNYDGGAGNGTFAVGSLYRATELILLNDGHTVTVDTITATGTVLTVAQDETDFDGVGANGTWVGGDGAGLTAYQAGTTITLTDGTIIDVDVVDGNGDVTEFTVTTPGTNQHATATVLTQTATTSSNGLGFTLTSGTNNEIAVGSVLTFTLNAVASVPFFYPTTVIQTSSSVGGSGFTLTPASNNITVLAGGSGATLTPIEVNGAITDVIINAAGTGYLVGAPILFPTPPAGAGATAIVNAIGGSGEITSISITNPGSGYEQAVATITVTAPNGLTPAVEFAGTVSTTAGVVTGIIITEGGAGYTDLYPTVTVADPTGTGATFTTNVAGGLLTAVNVVTGGAGYSQTPTPTILGSDGSVNNTATLVFTVGTNTFGTDPSDYNDVLTGQSTDAVITDQIQFVLDYFTALGYNIRAQTNTATADTMQWQIIW